MTTDLVQLYENEILPNIPYAYDTVLAAHKPVDKGDRYEIDCPRCKQREAYIYKKTGAAGCNRKNNCAYTGNLLGLLNGGEQPTGDRFVEITKQLCAATGVAFPAREFTSQEIADFAARDRKQQLLRDFNTIASDLLHTASGEAARAYLSKRGVSVDESRKREFGYYPSKDIIKKRLMDLSYLPDKIHGSGIYHENWNGRFIIPIKEREKICDFVAGYMPGSAKADKKYLRMSKAPDSSALLGLDSADENITLVEGYFDQFALDRHGMKNVVALGGVNLWQAHIEKFKKYSVKSIALLLDNDNAGNNGTISIIKKYANEDFELYVIDPSLLGKSKDPDEYLKKNNPASLKEIFAKEECAFRYLARDIAKRHNKSNDWKDRELTDALNEAEGFEQNVTNPKRDLALSDYFWPEFMKQTGITQQAVDLCRLRIKEIKNADELKKNIQNVMASINDGNVAAARETVLTIASYIKLNDDSAPDLDMQFIADMPINFLIDNAPSMPSLLTRNENGKDIMYLPKGIVASLIGAGGVGKTNFGAQLAISLTTGKDFLDEFKVTKAGPVALILGENTEADIHRLLQKTIKGFYGRDLFPIRKQLEALGKWLLATSVTGMNASFIDQYGAPSVFYEKIEHKLITMEPQEGWACIIFDPASRFMGPDAEKDNAVATQFISLLEGLTLGLKGRPTVLFSHHMNKDAILNGPRAGQSSNQSVSRGSSALTDGVRQQFTLWSGGANNEVKLEVSKANHILRPKDPIILTRGEFEHLSVKTPPTPMIIGAHLTQDDNSDEKDSQPNFSEAFKLKQERSTYKNR